MNEFFESFAQFFIDLTSSLCEGRSRREVIVIILMSLVLFSAVALAAIYFFVQ